MLIISISNTTKAVELVTNPPSIDPVMHDFQASDTMQIKSADTAGKV